MGLIRDVGAGISVAIVLSALSEAAAQTAPLAQNEVAVAVDSGFVGTRTARRGVVYSTVVRVPDATWIRLTFDQIVLGSAPDAAKETILRITSVADGAVQTLNTVSLSQWHNTSAYFNGDAVIVALIADPTAEPSRVAIRRVLAGPPGQGGVATICGPTDDRERSTDPRAGRALPIGCTAWIIGDAGNCLLTAGHCSGGSLEVVEFNVPLSDDGGDIQHPGPEDQYAVDITSKQSVSGGVGNDWGHFGCFPNTETGLTPVEAQGDFFALADAPPARPGQTIRITGYGVDGSPPQWNQIQQTSTGPFFDFTGTTVRYQVDTQGGNSGSPVIDEKTGEAIGIHTHGGCDFIRGANHGTAINHGGLQNALADPQGICIPAPPLGFVFPDGLPEMLNPVGDSIRVEVNGQNEGIPQRATGVLHFDVGDGFISVPMDEVEPNIYDAIFPAIKCTTVVNYFFSAETTRGEVVTNPLLAPTMHHTTLSAVSLDASFTDDFQDDLGWTVQNAGGLTDGQWQRGVPAGGGDRGDPPTDADGSGQCYVTDNADGNSDVDDGTTILTSPVMDATGGSAIISYWRWFSNTQGSAPFQDVFVVEVSDDGGSAWVTLETVGPNGPEVDGGWFFKQFHLAEFVEATDQFRVRFLASDADPQSIVEAGVDGVKLLLIGCGVTPGDLDGDGTVGIIDLLILLSAWGPCTDPPEPCPADLDGDGAVGILDLLTLLANWG